MLLYAKTVYPSNRRCCLSLATRCTSLSTCEIYIIPCRRACGRKRLSFLYFTGQVCKTQQIGIFLISLSDMQILCRVFGIPFKKKKKDRKELRVHSGNVPTFFFQQSIKTMCMIESHFGNAREEYLRKYFIKQYQKVVIPYCLHLTFFYFII